MKTKTKPLLLLGMVSGILSISTSHSHAQSSFTDIEVSNQATIGAAINFGSVQLGSNSNSGAGTSHGARLHVTQQQQEVWHSSTTPSYYQDNWVTVDDYGPVTIPGYYSPQYTWGIVSYNVIPSVYDPDGNLITPGYDEPVYGSIYSHDAWVPETTGGWGIVGSHQENQPVWVPESTSSYSEMQYDAPVIHSSATRSDANWVWDLPQADGSYRTILRLWDGGLSLPDSAGNTQMTLSPTSLDYVIAGQSTWSTFSGSFAKFQANYTNFSNGQDEEKSQLTSAHLRVSHTEDVNGSPVIRQTQIAARSASFGGVVEVAGDLKVQGTLRVPEQGDLSMGEFTSGPTPE